MPQLDDDAVGAFAADAKVALLATLDPDGRPHVTLITSLQARTPSTLMFGQFCEGRSKENVRHDPRVGVLVMAQDLRLWRCKARWSGSAQHGDDYELYNKKPMFRYNAYVGIHTIHYFDLVEIGPTERLSAPALALGACKAQCARPFLQAGPAARILSPWAVKHLSRPTTLSFVAYVGPDGFPWLVPLVPCQPAGTTRLALFPAARHAEVLGLEPGTVVACYAINLGMESVLVSGRLVKWRRVLGTRAALIDIDQVYNSMPPQHGVVYPPPPLNPARL